MEDLAEEIKARQQEIDELKRQNLNSIVEIEYTVKQAENEAEDQ